MWDMKKSRILRKEKSVGSAVSPPWTWNNGWSVTGHDDQRNYSSLSLVIACFWVNVIGQNDWRGKDLTGTVPILARDCIVTSSYFMPCRPLPSWGPWVNKIPRDGDYCFLPLLPVVTGTFLGLVRISNMTGLWTHGIKKCVPSPITSGLTPWNLSKITARWPPSTEKIITKEINCSSNRNIN